MSDSIQVSLPFLSDTEIAQHLVGLQEVLEEKKASDVAVLDLRHRSNIADYFVIAGANSRTHSQALASAVHQYAKTHQLQIYSLEGQPEAGWILIDFGFLVVHVMQAEQRQFYNLEELWSHVAQKV